MGEGDGVSSLNELNAKYTKWVKNSKIRESGSTGSCNANSLYTTPTVIDGTDPKRVKDYYLCGSDDHYHCKGLDWPQWDSIWGNCKMTYSGDRYDKCDNMATQTTDGLTGNNRFNMAMGSDVTTTYDPVSDTISGAGGCTTFPLSTDCKIGNVNGQRPAYPNNKTVINQVMPEETNHAEMSINDAYYTSGLEGCPTGISRELICALDGRDNAEVGGPAVITAPGCGFGSDDGNENLGKFCARDSSDYSDENIAQCCLGTLGNGPEVDTKGTPMSASYKNCPREFCTSRIAEGTTSSVNCDDPETSKDAGGSQDETFCYEMSKECNQFFTDKCTPAVFSEEQSDTNALKTHCNHWGHIQPESFSEIAESICNINHVISPTETNDYTDTPPTRGDLTHVKTVLDTPLCRSYITDPDHYTNEASKLQHLCSHYMTLNTETGDWEKQVLLDTEDNDVLENVCGCHYPDDYYTWWKENHASREAGNCTNSENVAQTQRTRETCEAAENTWTPIEGQVSLYAAIDDSLKRYPQCYYNPCIHSLLYNKSDGMVPCKNALNLCYNSLTQNNVVVNAGTGKITQMPDMTGSAEQTCNQLHQDAPAATPSDVGGSGGGSGFLSSFLGGSDDGTGSTGGSSSDSTTIIIVVIVIIIIIIGVVAVIMLNKGDPNPPQQIVQQPKA